MKRDSLRRWARAVYRRLPAAPRRQINWLRMSREDRTALAVTRQSQRDFADRMATVSTAVFDDGYWRETVDSLLPQAARQANLRLVRSALESCNISYHWVRNASPSRFTIAVLEADRLKLLEALTQYGASRAAYVQPVAPSRRRRRRPVPLAVAAYDARLRNASTIRVATFFQTCRRLRYGLGFSCDIEFWTEREGHIHTPRPNSVSNHFSTTILDHEVHIDLGDQRVPTLPPFLNPGLREVTFPIDAVYTWVDGNDPNWRTKMLIHRGASAEEVYHDLAHHNSRFESRDELKYSLRSLEMYAPWIRRIFLVTDGQVPEWLDLEAPGLVVVDHREIFDDVSKLPVFNSNAIISRLHRIPGLAEHYLYINDDFFFGRPVSPALFFTSGGLAKVFPSRNLRPALEPSNKWEPHINLTNNIRQMLDRRFGRSISHAIKHTPYPQLRSVHEEMAETFPIEYEQTSRSRFRHHDDFAADQLFHYYAQLVGRAVSGSIRYHYVNVQDSSYGAVLDSLVKLRDRDVFCLNDAPEAGVEPISEHRVAEFLETYFPIRSRFERAESRTAAENAPCTPEELQPW